MSKSTFLLAGMTALAATAATVEISSPDGGRAVADTYGARLVSWRPAGGEEVFALPKPYDKCPRGVGVQIHGGLPIYWPWFVFEGPEGCKIHGVTSYAEWKVKERSASRVVFELDDTPATRAAWPHRFHAELAFELGNSLTATFKATNTGDEPLIYLSDDGENLFGRALMEIRDEIRRVCRNEDKIDWEYTEYLKHKPWW